MSVRPINKVGDITQTDEGHPCSQSQNGLGQNQVHIDRCEFLNQPVPMRVEVEGKTYWWLKTSDDTSFEPSKLLYVRPD